MKKGYNLDGQVLENVALFSDEGGEEKKMCKYVGKGKIDLQHGYF